MTLQANNRVSALWLLVTDHTHTHTHTLYTSTIIVIKAIVLMLQQQSIPPELVM